MGSPKHQRKKYSTPSHPWQKERIEQEKILIKGYGLKNKKEIWRMDSLLGRFKQQAKNLIARTNAQSKKEEKQLIVKLTKLNLIKEDAKMDDILGLDIKNVMDRRLQTQVFSKGLARSAKQARQFITHGHIYVGSQKITVPSYLVAIGEENQIKFDDRSSLANPEHAERIVQKKETAKKPTKKEEKKKERKKPEKKGKKKIIKKSKGEKINAPKKSP